ncbi:unnamed protein product, partial [Linum tenue]
VHSPVVHFSALTLCFPFFLQFGPLPFLLPLLSLLQSAPSPSHCAPSSHTIAADCMGEVAVEVAPAATETFERPTVRVSNIPLTAVAKDLQTFLESQLGPDSVFAVEILTERKNWKSRGFGRVQFSSLPIKRKAESLSREGSLVFKSRALEISETYDDIVPRPFDERNRIEKGTLYAGFMRSERDLCTLQCWEGVRGWVLPEKQRVEFWVSVEEECYKLVWPFEDILETFGCCWGDGCKVTALLLKVQFGPRIYKKVSGPDVASRFNQDRYNICMEDYNFVWVRTTDFSSVKSIGSSNAFCLEADEESVSEIFKCLPYYGGPLKDLTLEDWFEYCSASETVPLVKTDANIDYEIIFQLNSLVHTQKISLAAVDANLVNILSGQTIETATKILEKLHQLNSMCYNPVDFVKTQLSAPTTRSSSSTSYKKIMCCHRALITPLKIYCLGPELESSNYVVKHFAKHAADFMRVTFVEEDWSKLPPQSISTSIQQDIFAAPVRTKLYDRILTILKHGFVIGKKKYEFLAFSASQLRSNAVWMFASNEELKAEHIREWMGCFNKIRSVSKCAARMGQLFSASSQTVEVPAQEVEIIPDIEITTDEDVTYCFSDGIGKISLPFARQVAEKCGLSETPSAFQIRYGGYKGVIAVDRSSSRKLSLRPSMLKFESDNRMLNVTKGSDAMPCYLNREIISLLSTLGVKDEAFESLQLEQLQQVGQMLSSRDAALDVLENLAWANAKHVLVKMLLQGGYEPNQEPYLSMMLQSYHESLLSELKGRCRVFVPKGRVLIGCLDESGILEYGQVYVRLKRTKAEELQCGDQSYFRKVDDKTSVLTGKVVVTKNPCLHPGDIRVLEAVYSEVLEEKGLFDCILFPQKGPRPHPNECSGGDLDGDLFFISWDKDLIPPQVVPPMDYLGGRPRIMDHKVSLEEIHKFFVDYMVNDTLGAISTAHLVLADREPEKACSSKCLELAQLHSMAVDFAKTGAPAAMPRYLKPREYPDFMERTEKPMYISTGVLGKLYRATLESSARAGVTFVWSKEVAEAAYDLDLEVEGFRDFLPLAEAHKDMYVEKLSMLMNYYDAKHEDEIMTGNLRRKAAYLQRDNRRYGETKDRILVATKSLQMEAKEWFENGCSVKQRQQLASAWYHVTYHPDYFEEGTTTTCLSFPWIVVDTLLGIKSANRRDMLVDQETTTTD